MRIVPLTLKQANEFVAKQHRHHKPVTGHRFSIGAMDGNLLVGIAVVGRPVARMVSQYEVAEITRCCTDGKKNCCSFLYAACARICREMGFSSIQTYTLPSEGGSSLKGTHGWKCVGEVGGGDWNRSTPGRDKRRIDQPMETKWKWVNQLRA